MDPNGQLKAKRGALRLLAMALKEAEGHDRSPMIGPNTLRSILHAGKVEHGKLQ